MQYKIVFIGPQGSGKGTQAEILAKKLNLPIFTPGNMFRQRAQDTDELSQQIKSIIDAGKLVPDEITNQMMAEKIEADGQEGYILDGYPRNDQQIEMFRNQEKLTHVVVIDIRDEESIRRIGGRRTCPKCQTSYHIEYKPPKVEGICDHDGEELKVRGDDTEEAIKGRLNIYHTQTKPLIDFFQEQGIVHEINGEQSIDEVATEINKIFEK